MKIGTYNLQFLFDAGRRLFSGKEYDFSEDYVNKRFTYFANQFDILDCDILFLEELGDESALVKVLGKMNNEYNHFIGKPDQYGVGNAVIYKKDLICKCSSVPTNTSVPVFDSADVDVLGQRIWSRRDFVRVETTHNKEPLVCIGVHIKSGFLMYENGVSYAPENVNQLDSADAIIRSEIFRLSQAKKIRELVQLEFDKDTEAQVVVLGDFNASKFAKLLTIVQGGIKNDFDTLLPILNTVPDEERYSVMGPQGGFLIDHVFISKSLHGQVHSIKIHNKHIYNQNNHPDAPYFIESDHAPVVFSI